MKKLIEKIKSYFKDPPVTEANWMEAPATESAGPAGRSKTFMKYEPDLEYEDVKAPVLNPIIKLFNDFKEGKVHISEAYLFEGMFDRNWKLRESKGTKKSYRIVKVVGDKEFSNKIQECNNAQGRRLLRESIYKKHDNPKDAFEEMNNKRLLESFETGDFLGDVGNFDPGQYTEFTPLFGGPYYKQLYLYDMLTMHARAFEARNHNPLAKRIIDILAHYSFGRRFKWRLKDKAKEKVWEDFVKEVNLVQRLSKFWVIEYLTFGELFIDKLTWNSVDPASIWDIVTDPDDITDVYYYYQSYSTPFTQFTGHKVPGVPGAEDVKPVEYHIKQIPFDQIFHLKRNVTSYEKRGRSVLYPILGWLKRVKDLYDAEVVRAQLTATFAWDVEITGSQDDVTGFMGTETDALGTGKTFYHNQQVKRQPMAALPSGAATGHGGIAAELLSFIATGMGIPKEFFNVMTTSSGNRATALVGAEPFTKLIEDIQADFEHFLLEMARQVFEDASINYEDGDIEFIFPSVTKDTTTETVTNIVTGKAEGFLDDQTASEMYAAEMNITTYDFEDTKAKLKKQAKENPVPSIMPDGSAPPGSPLHGNGKEKIKKAMGNL